jgi:Protein of unknown function (DUF2591)
VKSCELTGIALDRAVAHALGAPDDGNGLPYYSTDWAQGGPIIEREGITLLWQPSSYDGERWFACIGDAMDDETLGQHHESSPLIAAMRAYVSSKLGDFIEIPEELI